MNDCACDGIADDGAEQARTLDGNRPKPIAPACAIGELLDELNEDSTTRASQHRRDGRSARWYHFISFPLCAVREYLAQRPLRLGLSAFVLAALRAFGAFMTWAKVWEDEHCAGGVRSASGGSDSHGQ